MYFPAWEAGSGKRDANRGEARERALEETRNWMEAGLPGASEMMIRLPVGSILTSLDKTMVLTLRKGIDRGCGEEV